MSANRSIMIDFVCCFVFMAPVAAVMRSVHATHSSRSPAIGGAPCHQSTRCKPHKTRHTTCVNAHQPSSGNGKPQQQQSAEDDPVSAMLWAAQQDGLEVVFEDDDDDVGELSDVLEDLEDPWMRNPSGK